MSTALLLPCLAANGASWACCAANAACSLCCSLASCFGCKYNAALAKMTYLVLFFASAVLSLILRYAGEDILANVSAMANTAFPGFCSTDRCWGIQGAYRISLGTTIFFAIMILFTALVPITHLGGWLVKVFLYAVLLGVSFLPNNDSMVSYASVARGFSVIFLLLQVLIIIDFAYNIHEWLVTKMDKIDENLTTEGVEIGICSNGYRNVYLFISFTLIIVSIIGLALQYQYFGGPCPLHNFFISETLVIGIIFIVISMMNIVGKGLLPPSIIFAYNTYLCYGAITNNPDTNCNIFATNQSEASIYVGLAIAAFSITWMAYSSAGSMSKAIRSDGEQHSIANPVTKATTKSNVSDWPTSTAGKDKNNVVAGSAAAYQNDDEDDEESGTTRGNPSTGTSSTSHATDSTNDLDKPWLFHFVMCMGGMYLAMLVTNWGNPPSTNTIAANPELSDTSMWVRIGSQWAIHAVFLWTLIAPTCCPGRDFGKS